jgi:transcriptional regulator GlxA family with amidase domain
MTQNKTVDKPKFHVREVWILVYPGFLLLDATGPAQVFATANDEAQEQGLSMPYRIKLISAQGAEVVSSSTISVCSNKLPRHCRDSTTLIVSGGNRLDSVYSDKKQLGWLKRMGQQVDRCCAVCNGALLLGYAGLLQNKKAVTHWKDVEELRLSFPQTDVQDDAIYLKDGSIYTSAGISAGIDLCLSLVEEDLGREFALNVARRLVVYHKRPGGQRQFSTELLAQYHNEGIIQRLTQWLRPRLHKQVDIEQMAAALSISSRTLHRRVLDEGQTTPALLLRELRLEKACKLLESGRLSFNEVARRSGFGSEYNLRRAFRTRLGILPSEYRSRFG